jgi:CRP-like cAMP-binding protein
LPGHDSMNGSRENLLLSGLVSSERERLDEYLEPVRLTLGHTLYERDEIIQHVYFPTGGVMSILVPMPDTDPVEIATIGREGMIGLPVFLGAERAPTRAVCHIEGDALRMRARDFARESRATEGFARILHRYADALLHQIAQAAACNRVHSIEARACRWLLMTHDRVGADRFPLTQDLWARMLGVRRASVNVAAGMLHQQGVIRYSRGVISVIDRPGLEGAACPCYQAIRRQFEWLQPASRTVAAGPGTRAE